MLKGLGWLRGDDLILVARIAAVVLAIEIPVAVVATTLPVSQWAMSLIDAALLVLICAPVIFFWVVRPYVLARDLAEKAMKKSADQLRVRNEQFNAALQNMQHGLAMFDAQQRLIVCNARYAHMYGLSLDDVLPGTPLGQIVEARFWASPRKERPPSSSSATGAGSRCRGSRWRAAGGFQLIRT